MPTIVNAGHRSTNYWVITEARNRLLVDIGWPGGGGALRSHLERRGVPLSELRYAMATHYHIDHAGAAQELKQLGVPLLVLESQVAAIPLMRRHTKPQDHYVDIRLEDNVVISFAESRSRLAAIGIAGQVVPTPGHSDDSVTLVLDGGAAFTGDLTPPGLATDEARETVEASWNVLRSLGVTTIYPGHGPAYPLP